MNFKQIAIVLTAFKLYNDYQNSIDFSKRSNIRVTIEPESYSDQWFTFNFTGTTSEFRKNVFRVFLDYLRRVSIVEKKSKK